MDEMKRIHVSLTGEDTAAMLGVIAASGRVPRTVPQKLVVDLERTPPTDNWVAAMREAKRNSSAHWYESGQEYADDNVTLRLDRDILLATVDLLLEADPLLTFLDALDFELASFATLHEQWFEMKYRAPGFADAHLSHGWACAFRGDGHDRLVSRRWLDYGPWRVLRGPGNLALVQFHDLEADAETALEQARPGHQRMGISRTGGFIQTDYVYAHDLQGLYEADRKRHKIIINGRDVSQGEMRDAAATRFYRRNDPDRPLDSIAYVFVIPEEAHAHLHELWLREIEVWTFDPASGEEFRLDLDYKPPPPVPPAWVAELDR